MKKLLLNSLKTKNFKGLNDLWIYFDHEKTKIYGANGVGKTTISDAFSWLLFNHDSYGRSNFSIKSLKPDETEIHKVNCGVTGDFELWDMENDQRTEIELKKIYKEKHVKQPGAHTTEYYINKEEVSKRKYDDFIDNIVFDKTKLEILTNPSFFATKLNIQERRDMLADAIGTLNNEDIIASMVKSQADIGEPISKKDEEFLLKINDFAAAKKQIKKEQREIQAKIDSIPHSMNELYNLQMNAGLPEDPNGKILKLTGKIELAEAQIEHVKETQPIQSCEKCGQDLPNKLLDKLRKIKSAYWEERKRLKDAQVNDNTVKFRIRQFADEQKALASDYMKKTQLLNNIDLFMEVKNKQTEQLINAETMLDDIIINFFEPQINGGIKEVCDIEYEGVPYNSLNTGTRININLNLIKILSKAYDFYAPIWVDNAESVNNLMDIPNQTIEMRVSSDEELRIERAFELEELEKQIA